MIKIHYKSYFFKEIHIVVPYNVEDNICQFVNLNGLDMLERLYVQNLELLKSPFQNLINLQTLELVNCDFAKTNANLFECLSNLEVLKNSGARNSAHISYQKLSQLKILEMKNIENYEFLQNLSPNLIVLKIICSSNKIRPDLIFNGFTHSNLKVLHLVRNQFKHFDAKWIVGLTNLKHLIITDILIESINFDYEFLARLESVYLNNNLTLHLTPNIFSRLSGVQKLYLAYDHLDKLLSETSKEFLRGLSNLKLLDLRENHLTYIDPDMFVYTPNLTKLDLSGNNLKLNSLSFSRLRSLKLLDLSHNKLTYLEDDIFACLSNLEILNLYDNLISEIKSDLFRDLNSLRKICLGRNRFEYIRVDVFAKLKNLEEVVLSGTALSESNKKDISEFYPPSVNFKF